MVAHIGEIRELNTPRLDRAWQAVALIGSGAMSLPWERIMARRSPQQQQMAPRAQRPPEQVSNASSLPMDRPGCVAGDESGTALFHLNGLAAGWGGFGVLRTSQDRLRRAAEGARAMGDPDTAQDLEQFADRLPEVRNEEQARAAAEDLTPLVARTWRLAQACGKSKLTPATRQRAVDLAKEVNSGRMTADQAVDELRNSA